MAAATTPLTLAHVKAAYAHVLDAAQRAGVRVRANEDGSAIVPRPARDQRAGTKRSQP